MASGPFSDASRVEPTSSEVKFRKIDSEFLRDSFYRGEGNATLVLALPLERKVLRLRKSDRTDGDEPSEDDGETRVRVIVDFYRNVISELFGRYTTEPEIVRYNNPDLNSQLKLHESQRPENRRHKTVVENFATTLPDYTLLAGNLNEKISPTANGTTYCIEIKPKDGYIDDSLPFDNICDYCLKQFTEKLNGKIPEPSSYCPERLFSGESIEIHRAIRGLIDTPRNNFRIFKNGELAWAEGFERSILEEILGEWFYRERKFDTNVYAMIELIRQALLRPFPPQSDIAIANTSVFADSTNEKALPRDSVLETIYRVQNAYRRTVDSIYHIYSKYSEILNDEMIYSRNENTNDEKIIEDEDQSEGGTMPSGEDIRNLRNYLVHRISRDCSILMAFREIDSNTIANVPPENVIQISGKRFFLFNNAITDLDPKSVHCIEKHHRRENEILKYR